MIGRNSWGLVRLTPSRPGMRPNPRGTPGPGRIPPQKLFAVRLTPLRIPIAAQSHPFPSPWPVDAREQIIEGDVVGKIPAAPSCARGGDASARLRGWRRRRSGWGRKDGVMSTTTPPSGGDDAQQVDQQVHGSLPYSDHWWPRRRIPARRRAGRQQRRCGLLSWPSSRRWVTHHSLHFTSSLSYVLEFLMHMARSRIQLLISGSCSWFIPSGFLAVRGYGFHKDIYSELSDCVSRDQAQQTVA
jgi:hypothetical protein